MLEDRWPTTGLLRFNADAVGPQAALHAQNDLELANKASHPSLDLPLEIGAQVLHRLTMPWLLE